MIKKNTQNYYTVEQMRANYENQNNDEDSSDDSDIMPIENNISNLLLYENTNLACKQLDENQCSSVEKLHIDFFRNKNGDIEFV